MRNPHHSPCPLRWVPHVGILGRRFVRAGHLLCSASLLAVTLATAQRAPAQLAVALPAPCHQGLFHHTGYGMNSLKDAPYTATVRSSFEQHLADGNFIHDITFSHVARDSAGRTRDELVIGCDPDLSGQPRQRTLVTVRDPVEGTFLRWEEGSGLPKVVTVSPVHRPGLFLNIPAATTERQTGSVAGTSSFRTPSDAITASRRSQVRHEQLGSRSIAGVTALGTRTTTTIAPGEEGNDLPIVIVNEYWNAPQIGVVLAIQDDPRRGRTVMQLEDLNRFEPDPGLFRPPSGCSLRQLPTPPPPPE